MTAPAAPKPRVIEAPSGIRHHYSMYLGVVRTACGRRVPTFGWYGPVELDATCVRCLHVRPKP